MKMINKLFLNCIFLLLLSLFNCFGSDSVNHEEIFDDIPDLSIAVRINNFKKFGLKFDKMLNAIAPGWTLPGAALRPISSYLKAPDFSSLKKDSFLEYLIFKSSKGAEHFAVTAFKVEDASFFIRQIETFSAVTSNPLGSSITHFREEHKANSDFYIAVVHNNLVLHSKEKTSIEYAYTLYSRLSQGVIRGGREDIKIYLHCKRILISHAYLLDKTHASLVEDIASDLSADSSQTVKNSYKRLVGESLSELRNLANQFVSVRFSVFLNDRGIDVDGSFEIEDGSLALTVKDSRVLKPSLIKYLPERTLMFAWKSFSESGFDLVSSRVASLMSFLLDGAVDAETKDGLADLKSKIMDLQPSEAVIATVSSLVNPEGRELSIHGSISPDRIAMVKIGKPLEFHLLIKKISDILGPRSSFVEQLERNGITVAFSYEDQSSLIKGSNLHYLNVSANRKQDDTTGKGLRINFSRKYFIALNGNILLIATGPESEKLIRVLINSTKGNRLYAKSEIGRNTMSILKGGSYSSVYMIDPLKYIESSAMAFARYGQAYSVGGKPHKTVVFARQFREVRDTGLPFILTFNHAVPIGANLSFIPTVNSRLTLPYPAIRSIIKAILEPDIE